MGVLSVSPVGFFGAGRGRGGVAVEPGEVVLLGERGADAPWGQGRVGSGCRRAQGAGGSRVRVGEVRVYLSRDAGAREGVMVLGGPVFIHGRGLEG